MDIAKSLGGIAVVHEASGNVAGAIDYYTQSLLMRRRLPSSESDPALCDAIDTKLAELKQLLV
jgi:hypothetical protein